MQAESSQFVSFRGFEIFPRAQSQKKKAKIFLQLFRCFLLLFVVVCFVLRFFQLLRCFLICFVVCLFLWPRWDQNG